MTWASRSAQPHHAGRTSAAAADTRMRWPPPQNGQGAHDNWPLPTASAYQGYHFRRFKYFWQHARARRASLREYARRKDMLMTLPQDGNITAIQKESFHYPKFSPMHFLIFIYGTASLRVRSCQCATAADFRHVEVAHTSLSSRAQLPAQMMMPMGTKRRSVQVCLQMRDIFQGLAIFLLYLFAISARRLSEHDTFRFILCRDFRWRYAQGVMELLFTYKASTI